MPTLDGLNNQAANGFVSLCCNDDNDDAAQALFFQELDAKHKQIKAEAERNFTVALAWWRAGYNVVPQKAIEEKHPGVLWEHLQTDRVTNDELRGWRPLFANGVGFITGAISGVVVVDTDGPEGEALLAEFQAQHGAFPVTLTIRSGSGRGLHRYLKHPGGKIKTVASTEIKVDIKGDGGFCVLPPSLHKSGGRYEVVHDAEPAALPEGLLEFIEAEAKKARAVNSAQGNSNSKGTRKKRVHNCPSFYERPPLNRTNAALIQSMLDVLPAEYASEYDLWLRTGFALHDFDEGEVGLALWKRFSHRCPEKADGTDFEARWAGFSRDYQGNKISLGWLRAQAQAHGWRAPCRWDRSTKIES
jgi:hypothetical protein